jgi:hypothetical protein
MKGSPDGTVGPDRYRQETLMESCKPLPNSFPAKSDVVFDELLNPIEHPDPVLNKPFLEPITWRSQRKSFAI